MTIEELMEAVRALRTDDLIMGVEGRQAEFGSFQAGVHATKRAVLDLFLKAIREAAK